MLPSMCTSQIPICRKQLGLRARWPRDSPGDTCTSTGSAEAPELDLGPALPVAAGGNPAGYRSGWCLTCWDLCGDRGVRWEAKEPGRDESRVPPVPWAQQPRRGWDSLLHPLFNG